jgi:hypothetical protein
MAQGQGRDLETQKRIETEVFIISVFLFLFVILILWFFRDKIGEVLRLLFIADGYIAKLIHMIDSHYFTANERNLSLLLDYYKETTFNNFTYTFHFLGAEQFANVIWNGDSYKIYPTTPFYYYRYINVALLLLVSPIFIYLLNRMSNSLLSANDLTIRNRRMSLYFNDKILQKSKRKVVKTSLGKEFATLDYFPCYVPEDKEDLDNFVSRSIDYSLHPLNYDRERFEYLQKIWKLICKPHIKYKKNTNGKKSLIISTELYGLIRWSYIDKESIANNPKERMVFINDLNINNRDIPERNLFTSKNSPKLIVDYMKKYHYHIFKKGEEDIDFTQYLLDEDLVTYLEIKYFKKKPTYLNEVKKELETPLIYKRNLNDEELNSRVDLLLNRPEYEHFTKDKLKIERDRIFKEQKEQLIEGNKKYQIAAKTYFKNLKNLLNSGKPEIKFKQPVMPRTYVLNPIGSKSLNEFDTPGIKLIVDILQKYIISDYTDNVESQIAKLEAENSILSQNPANNKDVILENESIIIDLKASLDPTNSESRMNRLDEIKRNHKFEETYVVALWEYATSLANLPTGRLSLIKYDNVVLWYALTSIGRPFIFNAGLPISVMKKYEESLGSSKAAIIAQFDDGDLTLSSIFDEEFYLTIKNESLS